MQNLMDDLLKLLKKDERLISQDGLLLKNQTQELARKNDPALIKLLLSDKAIKQHFFFEIEKTLIFDKEKFVRFVSNKQFLPDSYTAFSQNVGLLHEDGRMFREINAEKEVVLVWPYKDCVLEGGMTTEDQERDEIFYNETLAPDDINRLLDPKVFTNFKKIDKKGEHKFDGFNRDEKGTIKDNLIIKGNNLLALASLKKEFAGKVKLIYIDPPYNTGSDSFSYNDNFNHSTWLTFMKNRFKVAINFLTSDGLIFVQCDDNEHAYLKVLMDEIFGRENFIVTICVNTSSINGLRTNNNKPTKVKDYILMYSKTPGKYHYTQQYELDYETGQYAFFIEKASPDPSRWKIFDLEKKLVERFKVVSVDDISQKILLKFYMENKDSIYSSQPVADRLDRVEFAEKEPDKIRIYKNPDGSELIMYKKRILDPYSKKFRNLDGEIMPTKLVGDLWTDIPYTGIKNEGGVVFKSGKKPERLLRRIIEMATKPGEIVLDYHAGSGTACAVAHKTGRQYIGIEQLDYEENNPEERLKNVVNGDETGISKILKWQGGGSFIYIELAKWNEGWIEKIGKVKTSKELAKLWGEMQDIAFLSYKVAPKTINASAKEFAELSLSNQKKFLIECLDKNQLYINLSEIEDKEYGVSKEDKSLNKSFYNLK